MSRALSSGSSRIRVLVAEDEEPLRAALGDLIASEHDLELVAVAEDAVEAIALAREAQPDVALLDVRMPGGGGPHAAREIRMWAPLTRVIALSAYEDRATVVEMLAAGAAGYLVKGTSPGEIVEAVRRAARGQASLSASTFADVIDALLRDYAGRSEAEGLLRRDEQRFRALLEAAPDAVLLAGPDGAIVYANRQASAVFGYEHEELIGSSVDVLVPATPEPTGRRKDGTGFPVDVSLSAVEGDEALRTIAMCAT